MKSIRWMLACSVIFGLLLTSVSAVAQTKTPDFTAYPQLDHLLDEYVEEWENNPEAFASFESIRNAYPRIYQQRRGTYVNIARSLERLGDQGLLPMLWALVSDEPRSLGYDLMMWWNWRVGLIESVGRLADERSAPVLMEIIEGPDPHEMTRQVATSALGRIGDPVLIEDVIAVAEREPLKKAAIIAGLGQARRTVAVDYLLDSLSEEQDDEMERQIVRALGDWGNQWAWQTSSLAPVRGEGQKGQTAIIATLVDRYPRASKAVQRESEKSLQLNGASEAAQQARARVASSDDPESVALWLELADRMDRSVLD